MKEKIFICFSAKDRYTIAQPIAYHLKTYGANIWYDRHELLMGDNRVIKNLHEGAKSSKYAVIILSKNTCKSVCASEEIEILHMRYKNDNIVIFPILYEITPSEIPQNYSWIKQLIFKEANKISGTREICNHIMCKLTYDIKSNGKVQNIEEAIRDMGNIFPLITKKLLLDYLSVDTSNLNSRITLLYAAYLTLQEKLSLSSFQLNLENKIFELLFSETKLNINIDYRELWLLENSICIALNRYMLSCDKSNM